MKEGGIMDISLEMACIDDLKRLDRTKQGHRRTEEISCNPNISSMEIIGYSALGHLKMIYTLITGDKILIYTDGRKTKKED